LRTKILIIETKPELSKLLVSDFIKEKIIVDSSPLSEFVQKKQPHDYHFIIVDVDARNPINTTELQSIQKAKGKGLLLFIIAKESTFDTLDGFSNGVDLYLRKPISNLELLFQIKVLKARFFPMMITEVVEPMNFANIKLNPSDFSVNVEGEMVYLTKLEFNLLSFFIINKAKALSRDTILNAVWGFNYDGSTRIIDVHVYNLKTKLKRADCSIRSVRGIGYCLFLKRSEMKVS
jgi:two-component system alkaline phosphatase synthesis response regulator PhoP